MTALDRARAPERRPARPFGFPDFERREFASGLELLRLPVPGASLVHLRLLLAAGGHHAPTDAPGLPAFTAALLDEGTARRSGPELATTIERLGGYLGTGAGWDATVIEAEVLTKDLATGLSLLAEVAREPSFPDHEIGRVRRQRLGEIKRRAAQPAVVASLCFEKLVHENTVYSAPLIGNSEALEGFDRPRVLDFYEKHVSPAGATLIAVGDTGSTRSRELIEVAEKALSGWSGARIERPSIEVRPQDGLRLVVVDRPGAAQTEIRLGHAGIPRSHPRYTQASVLGCLLGGKFTSRLNLNLREERGFTYGVRSAFGKRGGPAPFVVSTALANEHVGEALSETFGEIRRLIEEAPSEAEVADTRDFLIGSFPYTIETVGGLAARLSDLAVYELGDDYYAGLAERLAAVTPSDLLETARELLTPDRAVVVCAGPAEALRPQLEERFEAPVEIIRADAGAAPSA